MPEPIRKMSDSGSPSVPIRTHSPGRPYLPARNAAPALPPALNGTPDVFVVLRGLKKRWMLVVSLGVMAAGLAACAVYLILSPNYTAAAQVRTSVSVPIVAFKDQVENSREFATYQKTQAVLMKGRFVLNAALKKEPVKQLELLRSMPEPIQYLEEQIKVDTAENSEFVTISMMNTDPMVAMTIVKAVTEAYLDEVVKAEYNRKNVRLAELSKVNDQIKEKVRVQKENVKKIAEELGTSERDALVSKQVMLMNTLSDVTRQHSTVRFEALRAKGRLEAHSVRQPDLDKLPIQESTIQEALGVDPDVKRVQTRLAALETIVNQYKRDALDPKWPNRVRAEEQIAEVQKELNGIMARKRDGIVKQYRLRAQTEYEVTRAQLEKELEALTRDRESLGKDMDDLRQAAEKLGVSTTDLELLKDDIRREDRARDKISDELQALQIELSAPPRVTLAQEAGLQKKDIKRLLMGLVGGPAAAFMLVAMIIGFLEYRNRRIHSTEEVSTGLGMRVVGALPCVPQPSHRRLLSASADELQSAGETCLLESVDSIRTILLRDANMDATRVVMVTSALSGEGKTTLACQLASSLARAGRKTLLIDCDLRGPTAHQLFEQPLQPGFSEVLLGEVHVAEATRSTQVDGLWLMTAGLWDREVMHALARDGAEDIFERLKGDYDFIIVDSHPVLPANDSLLIGQHADAVLLSLLRDVSRAPRVYAACQRLGTLGIRIFGAVVSGVEQEEIYGGPAPMAKAAAA